MSGHDRLTAGQDAIVAGTLLAEHPEAYQCAELLRFTEPVDTERLRRTISDCLAAYPPLQSEYTVVDGRGARLDHVHIYDVDIVEEPEEDLCTWAYRRIDVTGPLRGETLSGHHLIVNDAGQTVAWVARFHHVIADGFGIHGILRWIAESYRRGEVAPPTWAEPAEIIAREDAYRASDQYEHDRNYFADQDPDGTGDPVPVTPLQRGPSGFRRAAGSARLSAEERRNLKAVAAGLTGVKSNETELLVALAAYYVGRLNLESTVLIGLPLLNRSMGNKRADLSPQAHVVPVALPTPAHSTVSDLVTGTAQRLREVKAHGGYRGEWIRRDRGVDLRAPSHGPDINVRPFSVTFDFSVDKPRAVRAELTTLAVGPITDVELIFQTLPDGGLEILVLSLGGLDDGDARRHALRLRDLLRKVSTEGDTGDLARLPIALEEETRHIDDVFNDTAHVPDPALEGPGGLSGLIAENLRRRPGDTTPALIAEDCTLSWADTATAVEGLADRLQEQHQLGPGDFVMVHLERSVELLLVIAAVARTGAAFVPVAADTPDSRFQAMREVIEPALVISDRDLGEVGVPVLRLGDARELVAAAAGAPRTPEVAPTDCAYVMFTSGSTGTPKAVAVPQEGILNRLGWKAERYRLSDSSTLMHKTPISFDVSVWELLIAFTHGVRMVVAPADAHREPDVLAAVLAKTGVDLVHFVPSALDAFIRVVEARGLELPELKTVICSGEALDADLARSAIRVLGVEVDNLYGPAEASIDVTAYRCTGTEDTIPIGAPVPNTRIAVLDDAGHPQPVGYAGELVIEGVQVGLGYLGQPELSAEKFGTSPRHSRTYRTGDLASWTDAGQLLFHGRRDDQIKLRGQRIELGEINAAAKQTAGVDVATALVVGESDGARIVLAYTGRAGEEEVAELTRSLLPAYMVPAEVLHFESFPVTRNGKLDRAAVAARLTAGRSATPANPESPAKAPEWGSEEEREIAAIMGRLTGETVGPEGRFFELGGTSLNAVELTIAIGEATGEELAVADVFACHSPRELAQLIDSRRRRRSAGMAGTVEASAGTGPLLTLRPHTAGIPVICAHPAGGLGWSYTGLLRHLAPGRGVSALQSPGLAGGGKATSIREQVRTSIKLLDASGALDSTTSVDVLGWSVGGVIAQELAVQLSARNQPVRKIVLLDAYPPAVWQGIPEPDEAERLEGVLAMAGLEPDAVEVLDTDHVVRAIESRGGAFGTLGGALLYRVIDLIGHNASLMREHTPARLDHEITVVVAEHNPRRLDPATWQAHAAAVTEVGLPVTHPQMVAPSTLEMVGEMLS